ncbi:MAG: hypothetical protein JWQ52_825 [Phenylobacterium sp.]|nr:hypothetical protein [Phenylobacterium sp.]
MAWRRACIGLALLAASWAPAAATAQGRPAYVVVVAGQSNALGYRVAAADLPPALRRPTPKVKIWDGARFVTMVPGRNTGSPKNPGSCGPEAGFAYGWRLRHPNETLYIVKYARGSTPLAVGPGPDWDPQSHELFSATQAQIAGAKAALIRSGFSPHVEAVLWMQGEADAADARKAAAYRANLVRLIGVIRAVWAEPASPVVIGLIPQSPPFARQVRQAQTAVVAADPRILSVDASKFPYQADRLHLTAEGQARLGAGMWTALQSVER